ncbi:MAG TPA: GNAT family N-acetyltransferase [Aquabacterium sp.]|nr:GNAT family N-acetyltransferase [Aquabacterium sp.]
MSDLNIVHHPASGCFETMVEGLRCEADYQLRDGTMHITHTGVPPALEGRGIAAQLVHSALSWARAQGYKVNPVCSYVAVYIRRHPEWQDLLA